MANERSPSRPSPLGELLSRSLGLRARTAHISLNSWRTAVGPRLAARTQPDRLDNGVLTVRVPSSTWAQELSLLSETVRERLISSGHAVERLRFQVSSVATDKPLTLTSVRRAPLPEELQSRLDRIEDLELRRAIAEAASYSLGRQR
jgi:predicted nucleic acid-binding Zn ribbon protein